VLEETPETTTAEQPVASEVEEAANVVEEAEAAPAEGEEDVPEADGDETVEDVSNVQDTNANGETDTAAMDEEELGENPPMENTADDIPAENDLSPADDAPPAAESAVEGGEAAQDEEAQDERPLEYRETEEERELREDLEYQERIAQEEQQHHYLADEYSEEEEEEEEETVDRARLIELYKEAVAEREKLLSDNLSLQNKIFIHLQSKHQGDENKDAEKSVTDHEQRYHKTLAQLEDLHEDQRKVEYLYDRAATDMKLRLDEKDGKAQEIKDSFLEFKREIARGSEHSRTGKPMVDRVIEVLEDTEFKRDSEVEKVRLKNIILKNQLRKLDASIRQKEELAEGLHLIDFEQLKIENQTFNEKIEDRNEELLKLRKKINTTVQVLTHLKEKLQFIQAENQELKKTLTSLEEEVSSHRDALTLAKQQRDVFRSENQRLKQRAGLVGNDALLLDYEKKEKRAQEMRIELKSLIETHKLMTSQLKELNMECDMLVVSQ
jgi:hypothetical protein